MASTATERFASAYSKLTISDIPTELKRDLAQLALDYFGVAIAGSRTGSGKIVAQYARDVGGRADARLIGGGAKVPTPAAAFANAIASHSIELDDVDSLAYFHFSPPVYSAALAVADRIGASGEEFMVAVAAGCDALARLSNALNPSHRNRGYHTTASCGVFGAAVAAARLLRLSEAQFTSALGLAGSQASGLMEMYGPSMQKRFNPGPAARNGVVAAELAAMGFTGAATILDGERGFCRAFSDDFNEEELLGGLGSQFPVHIEFKAHSCARPIHTAIDCALNVRDAIGGGLGDIVSIRMRRHPDWAQYHLNKAPQTYHEAQVSLPFSVAIALKDGVNLPPQYSNGRLGNPELLRLAGLVEVDVDASLPRGISCTIEVGMADGRKLESQVDYPRGSSGNPVDYAGTEKKVRMLVGDGFSSSRIDALVAHCRSIESLPSVSVLLDQAVGEDKGGRG